MRLYKLIGLEIEALQAEYQETMKNIALYKDILENYDSMAAVIIKDMDEIKKEYGRKRRTASRECRGSRLRRKEDGRDGSLLPDGSLRLYETDRPRMRTNEIKKQFNNEKQICLQLYEYR